MKYVLRFRAINGDALDDIRRGRKKIETRAATAKYRKIKTGDVLVFVCGNQRFEKKVRAVAFYKSIAGLFRKYKLSEIMPREKSIAGARRKYYSYPGYKEKIKKFGILAFRL